MKHVLIINAGSSSLKFQLFSLNGKELQGSYNGQVSGIGTDEPLFAVKDGDGNKVAKQNFTAKDTRRELLYYVMDFLSEKLGGEKLHAVGHRVVHGADLYQDATLINDEVIQNLKDITPLAPLHLPHSIFAMEAIKERYNDIPQVAVFDTAFHRTNPKVAQTYAIPKKLAEEEKLYRYGMHGISYQYITKAIKDIDETVANGKLIICHLGAGASISAVKNGKGIATTMGLTPLEGLPMGTRCGSIDPGLILYLLNSKGHDGESLGRLLNHESGMLGLTDGKYSDFRFVEEHAPEAWEVFIHSVVKNIGSFIALLKGVDAIIFTAGVGENSRKLRVDLANEFAYLGVELDEDKNKASDTLITKPSSKVKFFVIPTQEELMIAESLVELLKL